MKILKELVKIVNKNRVKNLDMIDATTMSSRANKLSKFYNGLTKDKWSNDEVAARQIYGTGPRNPLYVELKGTLRDRLFNNVLFLDIKHQSEYARERMALYRKMAVCQLLTNMGAKATAIYLSKTILRKSIKHSLNDLAVSSSRILQHYAALEGNEKDYFNYHRLLQDHFERWELDLRAESYYNDLVIKLYKKASFSVDHSHIANAHFKELSAFLKKNDSHLLNYYARLIEAIGHQERRDWQGALRVYDKLEDFLSQKYPKINTTNIYFSRLLCYLQINDFANGDKAAKVCLKQYKKYSNNYYFMMDVYILLCFKSGEYLKVKELLNEVYYNKKVHGLPELVREKFRIYEAYLRWLVEVNEVPMDEFKKSRTRRFDIDGFLQKVPAYKKDKLGFNIAILVVHILFLIHRKNFGKVIDRLESLKQYRNVYLKAPEQRRSRLFLNLLLVLEKCDFDLKQVQTAGKVMLLELKGNSSSPQGVHQDAEIIPYEKIWEILLQTKA